MNLTVPTQNPADTHGKYVSAVAAAIHRNPNKLKVPINLQGVAMGNGFTDPATMTHYGPLLLQLGLVRKKEEAHMTRMHHRAVCLLKQGRGAASFDIMDSLFFGILTKETYFQKVTGFRFYYNLLNSAPPAGMRSYKTIVQMPHVRRAIHVGDRPFSTNRTVVMSSIKKSFMSSEKGLFKLALANYRVLVFSGMLDICVATVGTESFSTSFSGLAGSNGSTPSARRGCVPTAKSLVTSKRQAT
ncbi:hypothetical protein HPB51_015127 [Rhipicephalus microplus]|uniref:Uncharacterized protein n=1 Tax=Rhipicephalus microplus TaxID=6941 RepID=A0A9J6DNA1_RHIMP|nr:hypothetical protein HPB51_015127 [Rhipicephalus microplus]